MTCLSQVTQGPWRYLRYLKKCPVQFCWNWFSPRAFADQVCTFQSTSTAAYSVAGVARNDFCFGVIGPYYYPESKFWLPDRIFAARAYRVTQLLHFMPLRSLWLWQRWILAIHENCLFGKQDEVFFFSLFFGTAHAFVQLLQKRTKPLICVRK